MYLMDACHPHGIEQIYSVDGHIRIIQQRIGDRFTWAAKGGLTTAMIYHACMHGPWSLTDIGNSSEVHHDVDGWSGCGECSEDSLLIPQIGFQKPQL